MSITFLQKLLDTNVSDESIRNQHMHNFSIWLGRNLLTNKDKAILNKLVAVLHSSPSVETEYYTTATGILGRSLGPELLAKILVRPRLYEYPPHLDHPKLREWYEGCTLSKALAGKIPMPETYAGICARITQAQTEGEDEDWEEIFELVRAESGENVHNKALLYIFCNTPLPVDDDINMALSYLAEWLEEEWLDEAESYFRE